MKDDINFGSDCLNDKGTVNLVKDRITAWADSIPHHSLSKLGEKVKVEELHYRPAFVIRLFSQYETRAKLKKSRPYKGESLKECTIYEANQFKAWDLQLDSCEGFENKSGSFIVAGSERVTDCHTCNATGKVTCPTCGGKGQDTCPACKGQKKVKCSSCSGSGKQRCSSCGGSGKKGYANCSRCGGHKMIYSPSGNINCPSCGGTGKGQQRSCSACHGSGKVSCSSCGGQGKVPCKNCNSTGLITCGKCHGNGQVTCNTCKGHKQIVSYFTAEQDFKYQSDLHIVGNYELMQEFPNFNFDAEQEQGEVVFSEAAEEALSEELLNDTSITGGYKKRLSMALTDSPFGPIDGSIVLQRQKVTVSRVHVYQIRYSFGGKSYSMLQIGDSGTVVYDKSPISELSDGCYTTAQELYSKGRYGAALDHAETAYNLDDQDNNYQGLNELYQKAIDKYYINYRLGAILGGLLSMVLFFFLSIQLLGRAHFIIPLLNRIYTPPLSQLYSFVVGVLSILFIIFLNNKIYKTLVKRFDTNIRHDLFRLLFSTGFSLTVNLFIWFGLIFISSTGLFLILTIPLQGIKPLTNYFTATIYPFLTNFIIGA